MFEQPLLTYAILFIVAVILALVVMKPRHSLRHIPGPPSSSWLFGNMIELLLPHQYGDSEFLWQDIYGPVYRIKGCFGEDRLMVSDPRTLKHVLDDTTFARSPQQQQIVRMLIGEQSLLYAHGNDHRRMRSVMTPAFSASHVRALPPLFRRIAQNVIQRWRVEGTSEPSGVVIDVYPAIHNATLNNICEGIMGFQFSADQDTGKSELGRSIQNIVAMSSTRSKHSILAEGVLLYVPPVLLKLALHLPTHALRVLRRNRVLGNRVSEQLIKEKYQAIKLGMESEKDLLTALVNANAGYNDKRQRMTEQEMIEQIPTIMISGQDTTGNTLSWCLYQFAQNPDWQERIRHEVLTMKEHLDRELTYSDLEKLTLMNAYIKEILRFHSGLPMSERIATCDAILPLSQPITTIKGEIITEIPVKKGQSVISATSSYNRLKSIWGDDADVFRPERWLEELPKGQALGPYANLMSFFGGQRACIGWRFALTSMQVLLAELLCSFTFSFPPNNEVRAAVAVTLIPVNNEGVPGLPICVKSLD
ncbi:cytochrome P450 [Guyanagaster necrorhizus]|uniref:Cytochrome P450 n=1 Tax=Guyanagaster necrorhizus TaxID=856835 RepID=A0A9P8AUR5_9AGAR|nr:cytochrome P450 [Guyanagaster necrorhizus MCA 3950]KAG7448520.1 cytochrome P450 [Guyanagaster necrorhizus MCA 3950]